MKCDHNMSSAQKSSLFRIGKRNAYHQAGHATAIAIGNKLKKLPDVYFQIAITALKKETDFREGLSSIPAKCAAQIEGGRLIPHLPDCYRLATRRLTSQEQQQCLAAFEADVVNLLVGSLAEAKYVALRDDEVFNANLVYLGALKFYGGNRDLGVIDDYMVCLYPNNKTEREQKLGELFLAAYGFINNRLNWQQITALAEILFNSPKELFTCEEIVELLDNAASEKFCSQLQEEAVQLMSLSV